MPEPRDGLDRLAEDAVIADPMSQHKHEMGVWVPARARVLAAAPELIAVAQARRAQLSLDPRSPSFDRDWTRHLAEEALAHDVLDAKLAEVLGE